MAELEHLLELARRHVAAGEHHAALDALDRARRLSPRHAETCLLQARCLLALDQPELALPKVDIAGHLADPADAALRGRIDVTRSACLAAIATKRLEEVRTCLRRGDSTGAVRILRRYEPMSQGDAFYAAVLAYASPDRSPDVFRLEEVLRWLAREELDAAERSIQAGRYEEALEACRRAHRVVPRGALAALRFAQAIVGVVRERPPDQKTLRAYLRDARRWAAIAADDPSLHAEYVPLATEIDTYLGRVEERLHGPGPVARPDADDELRRERYLADEVDKLFNRYNDLVRRYVGRPLEPYELDSMHSSFASLGADVRHLRNQHTSDSWVGRRLANLARAIDSGSTVPS
ncbi:MAG: hypothetical protein ACJ73S_13585 [Mycobacteriales bacterium]